jgi:hypothetical protein
VWLAAGDIKVGFFREGFAREEEYPLGNVRKSAAFNGAFRLPASA